MEVFNSSYANICTLGNVMFLIVKRTQRSLSLNAINLTVITLSK